MKITNILTNAFLASVLAISQNLFFVSGSNQAKAQSSAKPYVIFVNGQGNCCAWAMNDLRKRLESLYELTRNDFRYVPYSNFRDGGQSGGGSQYDWSSVDSQFLKDGENFINNRLDRNRPLILIGHSYGGDSILKLLRRINRRVQFVAVIDPVGRGSFRNTIINRIVPSNVDYFFNRWQENEPWPIDYKVNGKILCGAKKCDDQSSQFAHTDVNGNPIREKCEWFEISCSSKQVRTGHQSLPTDDYIEKIIGDRIQEQLANFVPFDREAFEEGQRRAALRVAAQNSQGLTVCNKTSKLISVAVSHFDVEYREANPLNARYSVRGWTNVKPGECGQAISNWYFAKLARNATLYIHILGKNYMLDGADSQTRLCVDTSKGFNWPEETNCNSSSRVTFSEFSRRERPGITLTIE